MPGELAYTKEPTAKNAEKRGEADPSLFDPLRLSAFSAVYAFWPDLYLISKVFLLYPAKCRRRQSRQNKSSVNYR